MKYLIMLFMMIFLPLQDAEANNQAWQKQRPVEAPVQQWNSLQALISENKLLASDGAINDGFGISVSISGNRALIGANGNNGFSGAVYAFEFDGSNWNETQKLTASDGAFSNDQFGRSISLSGNRALISAFRFNGDRGSAYIFDFDGTSWSETQKLTASDASLGDQFGFSVSLSGDRALIGATGDDDSSGSAYIFDFDGNVWNETQKLTAINAAFGDFFGISVSLTGGRALVGAAGVDDAGVDFGAAYVFEFDNSNWNETQKLTSNDGAISDQFGYAVSLSVDRALIGVRLDDDNGSNSGSAYVFDFDGNNWNETQKLTANDAIEQEFFGVAVSLSGDRAMIGAFRGNNSEVATGSAYLYELNDGTWEESQKLTASDGSFGDDFGLSVSLSGKRALVGAPADGDNGSRSGSAYVITIPCGVDEVDIIYCDGFEN